MGDIMKYLCFIVAFAVSLGVPALAEPVKNPLFIMNPSEHCKVKEADFAADIAFYNGAKVFQDEDYEGWKPEDDESYNFVSNYDFKRLRTFATNRASPDLQRRYPAIPKPVPSDKVLKSVLKTYNVALDFEDYEHQSYRNVVIAALVPCMRAHLKKKDVASLPPYEDAISICTTAHNKKDKDDKAASGVDLKPEVRFKDQDSILHARTALLRLFEAAETGRSNGFVVVRMKPWAIQYDGESVYSERYRPLRNGRDDDLVLLKYLMDPDAGMFEVHCSRVYSPQIRQVSYYDEFEDLSHLEMLRAKNYSGAESPLVQAMLDQEGDSKTDLVSARATPVPAIALYERVTDNDWFRGSYAETETEKKDWKWTLALVEDSSAFVDRDAASIGTVITSDAIGNGVGIDDLQVSVDLALGVSRKFTNTPKFKGSIIDEKSSETAFTHTNTLTSFYSVDRGLIKALDVDRNVDGTAKLDASTGLPSVVENNISFAEYSVGVRFDSEESYQIPRLSNDPRQYLNLSGSKRSGWVYGVTAEGIWDGYNIQSTYRIGADISLPERFYAGLFGIDFKNSHYNVPGYKEPYALDAHSRDQALSNRKGRTAWQAINNGLYVQWDADVLLDIVSYDRAPRDFTSLRGYDKTDKVFTTTDFASSFAVPVNTDDQGFLQGGQISLELGKRNLFGLSGDPAWVTFSLDYAYRSDHFSGGDEQFELIEMELKLLDPENSKRSFSIALEDGVDFRTRAEKDNQIEFKLGFIF